MTWLQKKLIERVGLPSDETLEAVRKKRLEQAEYTIQMVEAARAVNDVDAKRFNERRIP